MEIRIFLVVRAWGLAAASSGCRLNGMACGGPLGACGGPCGPPMASSGGCGGGGCATDCGPSYGSSCQTGCRAAPCETACAEPCDVGCGPPCRPCGPLSLVFGLINHKTWCGSGCGERYWGDWYGDPPHCHDPCDRCGNWTGGSGMTGGYGMTGGQGMTRVDPQYQPKLISSTTGPARNAGGPARNAGSGARMVRSRQARMR
jgi:hypothetical protein